MFDFKKILKQVAITLILCVPLSIIFKKHFLFVFFIVEAIVLTNFYLFKAKQQQPPSIKNINERDHLE